MGTRRYCRVKDAQNNRADKIRINMKSHPAIIVLRGIRGLVMYIHSRKRKNAVITALVIANIRLM
jgi:hypothetical protein